MTDASYTHYVLIVDRSGSMTSIRDDTEGGVRQFAAEQGKLPGRKTLSLYQFDDHVDRVCDFADPAAVQDWQLKPRGWTALWGAVGTAVTETGEKLAALPEHERPSKVVAVIATDGKENSSHKYEWSAQYTQQRVKDMVTHQQEAYGWAFTYIGANQDAVLEAGKIGVAAANSVDYTDIGTHSVWGSVSRNTRRYVGGQSAGITYSDEDRKAAKGS